MTERKTFSEELTHLSLLLLLLLGCKTAFGLLLPFLSSRLPSPILPTAVEYLLLFFALPLCDAKRQKAPLSFLPRRGEKMPRSFFPATAAMLFVSLAVSLLASKLLSPFPFLPQRERIVFSGGASLFSAWIAKGLFPAFFEEFFCRGILLSRLAPYGRKKAILFSSLAFAFLHPSPDGILYSFFGGWFLGFIALETGSVTFPFLMHLINNTLNLLFAFFSPRAESPQAVGILGFCLVVLTSGGILTGIFLLLSFLRREKKRAAVYPENGDKKGLLAFLTFCLIAFVISFL